ncbi:hypothetical protein D3C71_1581790 [compost metagenome]
MDVDDDPQQATDDSQQYRIGQLEPAGQRRHKANQCEQSGQAEYEKSYIHGYCHVPSSERCDKNSGIFQ